MSSVSWLQAQQIPPLKGQCGFLFHADEDGDEAGYGENGTEGEG